MKRFMVFSLLILFLFTGCKNIKNSEPGDLKTFIGNKNYEIISKFTESVLYKTEPQVADDVTSDNTIYKYKKLDDGVVLSSDQIEQLRVILLDDKTYDFTRAKKGFLFPNWCIEVKTEDSPVYILFDNSRKEIMYVFDGKEYIEDFDNAFDKVNEILNSSK